MEIIESNETGAVINVKRDELAMLLQCINETFEALDDWELPIRVGWDRPTLEQLRESLKSARRPNAS